jgi:uncharacterized protein (DUF427 family)
MFSARGITKDKAGPGQESVWDYPRPPRLERTDVHLRVELGGRVIAETRRGFRILETSHPPTYYFPPEDVDASVLVPNDARETNCEWKGRARYFDLVVDGRRIERAAWAYPDPSEGSEAIRDHAAFYAGRVDACFVDDERVTPQPGDFYGGWITSRVVGPFKGGPGSMGW